MYEDIRCPQVSCLDFWGPGRFIPSDVIIVSWMDATHHMNESLPILKRLDVAFLFALDGQLVFPSLATYLPLPYSIPSSLVLPRLVAISLVNMKVEVAKGVKAKETRDLLPSLRMNDSENWNGWNIFQLLAWTVWGLFEKFSATWPTGMLARTSWIELYQMLFKYNKKKRAMVRENRGPNGRRHPVGRRHL